MNNSVIAYFGHTPFLLSPLFSSEKFLLFLYFCQSLKTRVKR